MENQSDEIPLDIGFSLAGLLPMHCVYWNFDTIKIIISWYKATCCDFHGTVHILMLRPLL